MTGMRASVKKTSLNISSPVRSRIGRHSMPGVSMSMMNAVMPSCLRLARSPSGRCAAGTGPTARGARRRSSLLAVHDVLVAVADRHRAHVREVGAGLGLGEALAPVLVGGEDAGQPALLLLLGAPWMIIGPICQSPFAL